MVERLSEVYWDLQNEEQPMGLEEFVQRAVAGEYGPVSPDELRAFLRSVEERLIVQIQRRQGTAHEATAGEELMEETRGWIEELIGKFCDG
jgi:hypothetical protein